MQRENAQSEERKAEIPAIEAAGPATGVFVTSGNNQAARRGTQLPPATPGAGDRSKWQRRFRQRRHVFGWWCSRNFFQHGSSKHRDQWSSVPPLYAATVSPAPSPSMPRQRKCRVPRSLPKPRNQYSGPPQSAGAERDHRISSVSWKESRFPVRFRCV
jgi:hypothetical protein